MKLSLLTTAAVFALAACSGGGGGGSTPSPVQMPTNPGPAPGPAPSPAPAPAPAPTPSGVVSVSGDFVLQAENFLRSGGDGDIQTGNGDVVNFFNSGDFIEFDIDIDQGGEYRVTYNAASPETGAAAGLLVTNTTNDGLTIALENTDISTGDWNTFQDFPASGTFNIWHTGLNTIRLVGAGTSVWQFNTDYIEFERIGNFDTTLDTDDDGEPDYTDLCADTPTGVSVNSDGCATSQLDSDSDGITDDVDQCADTPSNIVADSTGCEYTNSALDVNLANPSLPSFLTFGDTTPAGKRWEMREDMSDEFDDGFDTTKWAKSYWNYGVPNSNQEANSGVSDGNLWIKATLAPNHDDPNHEDSERWFHTARVVSAGRIKFPAYTESRIKASYISAYNTYWLNNGDAENRDEIDIIENNARPTYTGTSANGQFHYDEYPWHMASQYFIVENGNEDRRSGDTDNRTDLSDNNTLQGVRWNEDYHVFGAWWKDENNVQFYLDGEAVGSVTTT